MMTRATYSCDKVFPKCVLCQSTPHEGIMGGQMVARRFFCRACLGDVIYLSPMDPSYDHVLECLDGFGTAILRRVWRQGG